MNGFLPLIEAFLAFALTMLALATAVSALLGVWMRIFRWRSYGFRMSVKSIYDSQIKQRLETGKQEIAKSHLYDYAVANVNVDESVDTILAIIRAEKKRMSRYQPDCPEIRKIIESGTA